MIHLRDARFPVTARGRRGNANLLQTAPTCLLVMILLAPLLAGCGGEPDYQGKTFKQWLAQTHSASSAERRKAYAALASYQGSTKAYQVLLDIIGSDETAPPDAFAAACEVYRRRGDATDLLGRVQGALRRQADDPNLPQSVDELDQLIFWLGVKAKPLLLDLEYAAAAIDREKKPVNPRLQKLEKIIDCVKNL